MSAMLPEPRSVQRLEENGLHVLFEWFDPPFVPPLEHCTQAYGICFTDDGSIVLTEDTSGWNLPGGGVESGETLRQTLEREIDEEICARVIDASYIGCQRVTETLTDPTSPAPVNLRRPLGTPHFQVRFWARVDLDPWDPKHETTGRALVRPEQFLERLDWGSAPSAAIILEHGLRIESAYMSNGNSFA